jgi:lipopolysaccharide export system protein LptA
MVDTANGTTNGTLTAATMLVSILGTNELQTIVAEKNVVIRNGENQFTSEKALYTATNSILELTGNPAWRASTRQGHGDIIFVDLKQNKMDVRTNAYMRLPASQLGPSMIVKGTSNIEAPKPVVTSQSSPASKANKSEIQWPQMEPDPPPQRKQASSSEQKRQRTNVGTRTNSPTALNTAASTNDFAEIYSEFYTVTTNAGTTTARFEGGVRIVHPRLNWVCQTMNVDSPNPTNVTMTAEQAVEFNLKAGTDEDQLQDVHGTCNHAVYNYAVTPSGTNDTMTLTENPILETTNAIIKNKVLILDCASGKLLAQGKYKIYGTNANTDFRTNMFHFPSSKKKK